MGDFYYYWFETDCGCETGVVWASSVEFAKKLVADTFPKDVGSDGFIEDIDGNEHYLWDE
jgi:hypothetical protein